MQLTEQQRMDMTPKGFGLPKKLWRQLLKFRNKTVKECASDLMFKHMTFYNAYMQLHPHRNFDYRFNSWGFRSEYDYEALNVDGKKAKIILAIGDSFTMNVGGPLEHSWPSLLQEKVDIPVLNGGVDGLGPDSYHLIVEKMRKYFDVTDICQGCGRSINDIANWSVYTNEDKILANKNAKKRITEIKCNSLSNKEWI